MRPASGSCGLGCGRLAVCVPSGFSVEVNLETNVLGLEFLLGRYMVAVTQKKVRNCRL